MMILSVSLIPSIKLQCDYLTKQTLRNEDIILYYIEVRLLPVITMIIYPAVGMHYCHLAGPVEFNMTSCDYWF